MILLSIMILSCPSRRKFHLQRILDSVEAQIASYTKAEVEVLVFYDNKKRSVGEKRNNMVEMSNGKYVTFLDDDDAVADNYVQRICDVLLENPTLDSLTFGCKYTDVNTNETFMCYYSKDIPKRSTVDGVCYIPGHPHIAPVKREIAISNKYKHTNFGEDTDWSNRMCALVKTELIISDALYFYNFDRGTSETVVNLANQHMINR